MDNQLFIIATITIIIATAPNTIIITVTFEVRSIEKGDMGEPSAQAFNLESNRGESSKSKMFETVLTEIENSSLQNDNHTTRLAPTCTCNIVEHAKLQLFFSSEVKPKWLVRTKLTHPPCSPSAWTSARRWQDRGTPSTSPSPLVPPSPSPWTPGARK